MPEREPRFTREQIEAWRGGTEFATRLRGHDLRFRATWGLFSPREVDAGTAMLIDCIEVAEDARCIDVGCGYGPLGLTLARLAPRDVTWLVDRDFVAVEYARRNAELNGISNVRVALSNGFDEVPQGERFDLVASNLPAKVGNEMLTTLIADAHDRLDPGGRLYVVTLSGMRKFIQRAFLDLFGNYEKVRQGRQHTVSLAVREAAP
jgi:16S rRNA (guanine1207-N2)-methyltransferase